ncbi:unnamed protein product [Rotaria sordida]|uniref:RING-type domain-containing protein n=2 Tax=Rotaria sordida TaxID=392033 RepID=A0A815SBJ0_9BILA|nr:unnamed protein product [Rotaria sordida]CAF1429369.1 unnamed protein product [Rotaria sordida]CAF1488889.1 unnamed protein product [Rotaria sordida]CAF1632188.1 unnamed protein product [Rotaria sordida]CAF3978978.1 unnamed protein product [Rotaria sordida]
MAINIYWEHMTENIVDEELFCPICTDPFEEPVCANQCGHTFCRKCIIKTFRITSQCPTCRHTLTIDDFHPITTRPFLNQLNKILVKCKWCSQSNIQRGDFKDHIKTCTKTIISCPAANINCDWKGQPDQIQGHVEVCPLVKIQPTIVELKTIVKQQSEQIRFLYTIFKKTSEHHKEVCKEAYIKNGLIYCDVCKKQFTINEHQEWLHFCPEADICFNCVKKYFT